MGRSAQFGRLHLLLLTASAIFLTVLFAIGCNPPPAPGPAEIAAREMRIVIIGPGPDDPRWDAIIGGARLAVRAFQTAQLDIRTPVDSGGKALDDVVDSALALEPHAVCLAVVEPAVANPAAARILKAGMPLVTFGTALELEGIYGHVEWRLANAAGLLGESLEQLAGANRNYILIHRDGASPGERLAYLRFRLAAREAFSLHQLQEVNVAASRTSGREEIRRAIDLFPSTAIVVTLEPSAWLNNPEPRDTLGSTARFATTLAVPELWPALMKDQAIALCGSIDGEIGRYAIEMAIAGITHGRPPGRLATVECEIVTRRNLEDFSQRYLDAIGK